MTEYIQLVKGSGDNIHVSSPVPIGSRLGKGLHPLPNHWTLQAEFLVFKLRPIDTKYHKLNTWKSQFWFHTIK